MADNKLESQIWEFKSPEELAKALEAQNQKLADKVRDISKRAIETDSKDLRKRLQDELTPEEQLEIRETLPNSGVGKVLNKGLTKEERQAEEAHKEVSGIIWEDNAKNLAKAEWYSKSLWDAWDVAGKLFEEGKWIAAIGIILKGLFWQFSLKAWEKKDGNEEEKQSWKVDIKYQYASSSVSYIFWWESKNTLNKLFALDKFQTMRYHDAKVLHEKYKWEKNKDWLQKELWIEWVTWDEVFKALWILVDENVKSWQLLSNFYSKKWEEIWNKTIKECVAWLYSNIKMFKNLESISTPDQIIDAWKNFALKIEQLPNWESEIKWEIYDSLKELWITKNIILFINARGKNWFENIIQLEKNLDWIQSELSKDDKKELKEKFIPFAKNIETSLSEGFWHDYKQAMKSCFDTNHLKPNELLELYAITWGNHSYDKLNDMQKTYIYTKLISLLDDRDPKLAGSYGAFLIEKWETTMPPWVLSMLWYLWWKLKDWASKVWSNLLWAAKESPVLAWIIALTLYFWPWFSAKESMDIKVKRIFKK